MEIAAKRGVKRAIEKLEGPPFPDVLMYLYDWIGELYGRSGAGMAGVNPLTYGTIADWARLTGRDLQPHEVHALITLDAVLRHPEPPKED